MKRILIFINILMMTNGWFSSALASNFGATIVSGTAHTCAVTTSGRAKCWGLNDNGQLGDDSTLMRLFPVDASNLTDGIEAVAAGSHHTCALTVSGGLKCWGKNNSGQLGDRTNAERHVPAYVSGLSSDVIAVATGESHTCAVTTSGTAKCWGLNYNGQLGDGTTTTRIAPGDVSGLGSGVKAIAAGASHTCVLTQSGGVKCWGKNNSGQLGDGSIAERHIPAYVSGLASDVIAVAAGESHTCAVTTSGGVKCWGLNDGGQLGDNSTATRVTPVNVSGLSTGVNAIATGSGHTCALTESGGVTCWGKNNSGQLGDRTNAERHVPVNVTGLASDVVAVAAGESHTCAATASSGVKCWGANDNGQLGNRSNSNTLQLVPGDVPGLAVGGRYLALATGWNLVGNSINIPINVPNYFGDASKVASLWKWVTAGTTSGVTYPNWAIFLPGESDRGQAYAKSKGYDFIVTIDAGEGFWINAITSFKILFPTGAPVSSSSFMNMSSGWHLISTGNAVTPSGFNTSMNASPPPAGVVSSNFASLWAWDVPQSNWYFYAPALDAKGGAGLSDFISQKGYLDFSTDNKLMEPGMGFWINIP